MKIDIDTKTLKTLDKMNISPEEAVTDFLLLNLSEKIARFKEEADFYKTKYNMDFKSFENEINNQIGSENFEKDDDLMAWKFAEESREYYQTLLNEIK